jgi:hypothetical protein
MAALPALAGPARGASFPTWDAPPILIRVPDVTVARVAPARAGRRRRLRRDRVALALCPLLGVAGLVAWGRGRERPAPAPRPSGAAATAAIAGAVMIEASFAEPLPLAEPLVAPSITPVGPVAAVRPAGYLIPDDAPRDPEGPDHADPGR